MKITAPVPPVVLFLVVSLLVIPVAMRGPLEPVVRNDRPGEALAFRTLTLRDDRGAVAPDGLIRAKRHVAAMRAARAQRVRDRGAVESVQMQGTIETAGGEPFALSAPLTRDGWTWIGPGNVGGRVRAVVVHPSQTGTMFAGSVSGGIWKSTNGGAGWAPVNDFMANLAVTSLVFQPGNPLIMYASTGEGFGNADAVRGAGIFKSTDGGTTWTQLPATATPAFYYVLRLAISPDGRVLLAGTVSGLYRSADGGATWSEPAGPYAVLDVDFHPSDSRRAVAGDRSGQAWYTTDGGRTWSQAWLPPDTGTVGSQRVEIAYARSDPAVVYAVVDRSYGALFRSVDGGATFAETFRSGYVELLENNQGWYDLALWVNPRDRNDLLVGGVNLYRSRDGGVSFTQVSTTPGLHADQHVIVEHPRFDNAGNRVLYIGNDGGVYKVPDLATLTSADGGQFVELNNNLGVTQFYGAAGNSITGAIVGGTQDNGTLLFTPEAGSEGWESMFGGDGGVSAADPYDPSHFYGEYVYLQLHRSADGGRSASFIFSGLGDAGRRANFIAPFVLDPNRPRRLLAGGQSLWRTDDAKATDPVWRAIKGGWGSNYISAIAIAPGNADIVWVGHNNGELYRTLNGTAATPSWKRMDPSAFPNRFLSRITIDPLNHATVYVAFGGFEDGNLQRTTDGGATWADATGIGATGLPHVPVRDLEIDPTDSHVIWAGTEVGVFTSADRGATWDVTQDGPANVSVDELFVLNGHLYAVTHGRGLFRHALGGGTGGPSAPPALPAPWVTADVGAVGVTGAAAHDSGMFTVRGAGEDVWGTADAFRFVYQPLPGDGEIVARVASVEPVAAWVKAGVMIRQDREPGSAHGFMLVSASKGLAFQRRAVKGGTTTHTAGGNGEAPAWVKIARKGTVVTASRSSDGSAWTTVGQDTIALNGTVLVGLAVSSHDAGRAASVVFDRVTVTPGPASGSSLPAGWQSRDVGDVGRAGGASHAGGVFTVKGAGADVWDTADAFHFAYRTLTGDGAIVARVAAVNGAEAWTKVGIMMRAGTGAGAAHAMMIVSKSKGLAFQRRTSGGKLSTHTSGGSGTAPRWVRLVRAGATVTAAVSSDGKAWTVVGSDIIALPADALVGLVAHSHDPGTLATGTFDHVSVTAGGSLPGGWTSADVGATGVAGGASGAGETFTVTGAGADIWGSADAFHFAWTTLAGDGDIVARVPQVQHVHAWTKAGVMIRESAGAGAPHAHILVSAGKGTAFQRRRSGGGVTVHTSGGSGGAPRWVKLARRGQVITASVSADGASWTVVGSDTFSMPGAVLAGLALSSHDPARAAEAAFEQVRVTNR